MPKISSNQQSLLAKVRHLGEITVNSVRRSFNNGELRRIRDTAWNKLSLSDEDIALIRRVKHLIGQVYSLREKNKRIKRSRAKRRRSHHCDVSGKIAHENDFLERSYLDTRGDAGQAKPAKVHEMPQKQEASCAA